VGIARVRARVKVTLLWPRRMMMMMMMMMRRRRRIAV
jgi:hypothetical protein